MRCVLPKSASAKLPTRGMTTVTGTINGHAFQSALSPDGQRSHWLTVDRAMGKAAGAGGVVRDHDHRAQGLDSVDHFRQAG